MFLFDSIITLREYAHSLTICFIYYDNEKFGIMLMDNCKERILSNNYFDLITDYPISSSSFSGQDLCYVDVDNHYNILYTIGVRELSNNVFEYLNLPKLYGLMDMSEVVSEKVKKTPFDPNSLIASGILQAQRPPLSLTGSGGCDLLYWDRN